MKRVLVALLFAAAMAGGSAAYAGHLSATAKSLGAGAATVEKCSSASWVLTPQYSADTTTVTGVIVSGIATACLTAGGTLAVAGSTATLSATGSVPLSAATTQPVTVPFSGVPSSLPTVGVTHLGAAVAGS